MKEQRLILASASPRRKALLSSLGYDFEVIPSGIDEHVSSKISVEKIAEYLAHQKAVDVFDKIGDDAVVLGADTIVVLGNEVLGKPADRKAAYRMLAKLSGKMHLVYTGVSIISKERSIGFTSMTRVFFRQLNDAEIRYYIDSGAADDKAGAYGIQDWIGLAKISDIEGSYNNVIGLPTALVYEALANLGF